MNTEQLIGVINVESHKVKFSVLNTTSGQILLESSKPIDLIKPNPGWVEVNAEHVWDALCSTIDEVIEQLKSINLSKDNIKIIGIVNERETALAWNSETHKPIYNAIHCTDTRTDTIIQEYESKDPNNIKEIEDITGLRVTSLFSGAKLKWIVDNTNITTQFSTINSIKFGTLDTWLVWKLTKGKLYITDITNASRTLLMNIRTCEWSLKACQFFNIPIASLPTIQSSSQQYGIIEETGLNGLLIGSILANHNAALYSLNDMKTGQIMSRYCDSCIVSCIVGTELTKSYNGLITTVAYKIENEPAVYALEGWTSIGGKAIDWLRNNMRIIVSDEEIKLLNTNASDVYFVPAFNGLTAPHWNPNAKGIICGITHYTNKNHLIRAALESICFHTKDVCVAFERDTGIAPYQLTVDGPFSVYSNLLNYQADILGIDVKRSQMTDMAIYGSAKAAARVINIELNNYQSSLQVSKPTTTEMERKNRYSKWLKAIKRSSGLSRLEVDQESEKLDKYNKVSSKILSTVYLMAMMAMMVLSDKN